jgi:Zn-dependent protease with chaperone function
MRFRTTCLALSLAAAVAAPALAQTAVDRGGRNLFSKQQDIEIGQQAAAEAEKQYPLVRDQDVQLYIQDLGQRLAAQAPGYKFPYTFKVVDVSDINAFALPGGPVYVNRGTIEQARTEGELAGVMAHEISHVDLRHGTRQATKAYGAQMGLSILGALIGSGDTTSQIINTIGGFSLNSVLLKYSRSAESDADVLGSQIMARAGYDPKEMATFFDLLAQQSTRRTSEFFSSHPAPERRRDRIEKEAALLGVGARTVPQQRFKSIQARLKAMPPAPTTEQLANGQRTGTSTGSTGGTPSSTSDASLPTSQPARVERPSRNLAWYSNRQRLFRVAYPDNWDVVSESDWTVTLAAPGGAWRSSRGAEITHGAMLGRYDIKGVSRPGASNLDDATDEFVSTVRRDSPYLRAVPGSRRHVTIDGGDGLALTLSGAPDSGSARESVEVVTALVDDQRLVYMLFIRPERAAADYDELLDAMIRNLRVAGR